MMKFTGERPTQKAEIQSSRLRYKALLPYCVGRKVFDFGCGIGHGSFLLAKFAQEVRAYDPSKDAIAEAQSSFECPNLEFVNEYTADHLKWAAIVVAVESIEHLGRHELKIRLDEFSRHTPQIACTTPNGDLFPYHPKTPEQRIGFHRWHYTEGELQNLFGKFYPFVQVSGHAFDPALGRFTGYTVFASHIDWKARFLKFIE